MNKLPISRTHINGKRRIVISMKQLAKIACISELTLQQTASKLPLRKGIDYVYKDDNYLLTLATCQTLLAISGTEKAWKSYHSITDFLQSLNNKRSKKR